MGKLRLHPDGSWVDIGAERHRQRTEAERLVNLAWNSGFFDHIDPPWPKGDIRAVLSTGDGLVRKCIALAEELLQGQYPEVRMKGKYRGPLRGLRFLADGPPEDQRPRVQLEVTLRRRLTYLRLKRDL